VVEHAVELVDGSGPERIAHLGSVERNTHRAVVDRAVICDVDQVVEALDRLPAVRVKQLGHHRTLLSPSGVDEAYALSGCVQTAAGGELDWFTAGAAYGRDPHGELSVTADFQP
jgi:hypothetical protein